MRILAFSDWRRQKIERIKQVVQIESPDLILYGGDQFILLFLSRMSYY